MEAAAYGDRRGECGGQREEALGCFGSALRGPLGGLSFVLYYRKASWGPRVSGAVRNTAVGGGCGRGFRFPPGEASATSLGYVADWLVAGHAEMKVGSACSGLQFEFDWWGYQGFTRLGELIRWKGEG